MGAVLIRTGASHGVLLSPFPSYSVVPEKREKQQVSCVQWKHSLLRLNQARTITFKIQFCSFQMLRHTPQTIMVTIKHNHITEVFIFILMLDYHKACFTEQYYFAPRGDHAVRCMHTPVVSLLRETASRNLWKTSRHTDTASDRIFVSSRLDNNVLTYESPSMTSHRHHQSIIHTTHSIMNPL